MHLPGFTSIICEKAAQVALHYGASDADGTIIKEKIIHDAGASSDIGHSRDFMVNMIKNSGYTPVERDALYNEVQVFN